jgi:hypothetical protein
MTRVRHVVGCSCSQCTQSIQSVIIVEPIQGTTVVVGPGQGGARGLQGTQGTAGSVESVSYVYSQNTPSATWTVTHNLNFYPNVTFQDSAGTIVEGEINYTTRNTLTATFSAAFSGKAYLS